MSAELLKHDGAGLDLACPIEWLTITPVASKGPDSGCSLHPGVDASEVFKIVHVLHVIDNLEGCLQPTCTPTDGAPRNLKDRGRGSSPTGSQDPSGRPHCVLVQVLRGRLHGTPTEVFHYHSQTEVVGMVETCPICGKGELHQGKVKEEMFGVELGMFDAEVCTECGESFLGADGMDALEKRAKELGLWGLASKVKIVKSGNSLVVRIPSALARYLKVKSGQEVMIAPERNKRLVLELA